MSSSSEVGSAGMAGKLSLPDMSKVVDQFAITAEKTTIGTTEAMAKLTFSAQASFDKVEAVAIKFSGG